jgi:uncharacterized repeat protein (TIGR01451 family)
VSSLAAGGSVDLDVTMNVDPDAASGAVLPQEVMIAADQPDTAPANNVATVESTVARATDVAVTVVADSLVAAPGDQVGFTVTVTNLGPLVAHSVVLTNALPALLTNPADPPACTFSGDTATCSLGTMEVGAKISIHFSGNLPASAPDGATLVNKASVAVAEIDSAPANDTASATTTVSTSTVVIAGGGEGGNGGAAQTPATGAESGTQLPFTGAPVLAPVGAALLVILFGNRMNAAGRARRRRARDARGSS